jgi:predicted DNA-binding protein with PD1-like motif
MSNKPAVIDSASGSIVAGSDQPFILALKIGENLFEAITRCAQDAKLESASISGLGALDDVTIAYYNMETKTYQTKLFTGMFELVSLNGNIAVLDGQYFTHIHAAIGDDQYQVFGGHIMDATVGPSAEITVIPLCSEIHRKYDERTGLKIMCPMIHAI